ncbi:MULTISPECIES: hypothetical protein [Prauserella salsuginis group]|uniref:PE family protein n=1 Tax=Prauserella salsuginis TaxID=387889 RepID=A0ABW6FWN2_9PSEU|nr:MULTISPECIES: hypothetical protein [Prauserella salsuginis group]MCR3720176.1 hypothetical protein [Prauserella flava]MCR3734115.1 hypothetical protein [Prauserella salsuginis]
MTEPSTARDDGAAGQPVGLGDGAGPVGAPPTAPALDFAGGAADRLVPVAEELNQVREQIDSGELRLDEGAAHNLLATLMQLQGHVHRLIADAGENIAAPLRFGDNFVGETLAERLRGAAEGDANAALPVLTAYAAQLEKLEGIVRAAAGMITTADEEAGEDLQRIGRFE